MCTIVLLRRPGHAWPLLLAANRDEMADRPWRPPARHWPDRPAVIAGLDVLGGGTWLGVNDAGMTAAVLNRINTLGPAPGRRSRGELPLAALDHTTAWSAAASIVRIDPRAYRPFNMVIADAEAAYCVRCTDRSEAGAAGASIGVEAVPDGLSMITAYDRNDLHSPRIRRYLPSFAAAPVPRPEAGDWSDWISLLAARDFDANAGPGGAMTVITSTGFGTVSSSLLALPAQRKEQAIWLFAAGRPGETPFRSIRR
jgi:Transport and Golgi organisation 2